ncbi:hypothetical protein BDF14DRAFT_1175272 [Spinellus fusiger]|nr:hypothetical protein BDF14DRAFT_1175272 [Spinellus fusiger]
MLKKTAHEKYSIISNSGYFFLLLFLLSALEYFNFFSHIFINLLDKGFKILIEKEKERLAIALVVLLSKCLILYYHIYAYSLTQDFLNLE